MEARRQTRQYASWQLRRIAIPECPRAQVRWLDPLEQSLVRCIPGAPALQVCEVVSF
jgi:hypothetical protein